MITRRLQGRWFHSYEQAKVLDFTPTQAAIASAALKHVPQLGFSYEALAAGAKDCNITFISRAALPYGPYSIAHYHLVTQRLALKHTMTPRTLEQLCVERLKGNERIIHRWSEALGLMSAHPTTYGTMGVLELGKLSDEMWFLAGDLASDFDWYTKRMALSGVYAATELYMTTDTSDGFQRTWEFLRRRIEGMQAGAQMKNDVAEFVGFGVRSLGNVLRSKGITV